MPLQLLTRGRSVVQQADTLSVLHLCRDIKPENILIMDDVLKLADFGSCRGIYSKQPYTEYISTRWCVQWGHLAQLPIALLPHTTQQLVSKRPSSSSGSCSGLSPPLEQNSVRSKQHGCVRVADVCRPLCPA